MKIGQVILTDTSKRLEGNFIKIGIQTPSNVLDNISVKINDEEIFVTPLTHIYELEGVSIKTIQLITEGTKIYVDYIGEGKVVNANG